jgi:hypothetical protein
MKTRILGLAGVLLALASCDLPLPLKQPTDVSYPPDARIPTTGSGKVTARRKASTDTGTANQTPPAPEPSPSPPSTAESKPHPLDGITAAQQMVAAASSGDLGKGKALFATNPNAIHATNGNAYQSTPLHFAAYNGRTDFARWLIAQGADVKVVNQFGIAPLHDASSQGHRDIVQLLLEKQADINARDTNSKTPLQYALDNAHEDVAEFLRQHGAEEP